MCCLWYKQLRRHSSLFDHGVKVYSPMIIKTLAGGHILQIVSIQLEKCNIFFFHHKNNSSTLSTWLQHVADDWHHAELEICCLWYKQLWRHSSLFDHGVEVYSPMIIKTLVEWKLLQIFSIWLGKRNIFFFNYKYNISTLSTWLQHVADDWHHAELEICCLWYKQLRHHSSLFEHGVEVYSRLVIKTLVEWYILNILPIWLTQRIILFFHNKNNSSTLSTSLPHVADDWHHAELEICCLRCEKLRRHSSLFDHGVKVCSRLVIITLAGGHIFKYPPDMAHKT